MHARPGLKTVLINDLDAIAQQSRKNRPNGISECATQTFPKSKRLIIGVNMQLTPSEISELIKSRIQGLGDTAEIRNHGTIISVTDGIVLFHGLSDAMQGEMLEIPGNTFGLALNLERDSVGAVILCEYEH